MVMSVQCSVYHVWHEMNQKRDEEMSRRSSRRRATCRGRSINLPRSNSGTPLAWVLKGADRGREDIADEHLVPVHYTCMGREMYGRNFSWACDPCTSQ